MTVVRTEPVYLDPPERLTDPVPPPEFEGQRHEDLLEWSLETREALERCNRRISTLQQIMEERGAESGGND